MVLKAHNSIVNSIKFIENKNFLASVEKDCKIIIWKLTDHSKYALLSGHSDYINEILIIKDEKFIISYDFKDGIKIWDIDKKQENNLFTDQKQALKWLEENRFEMDLVERYLKI